jgi:hypothetical protein
MRSLPRITLTIIWVAGIVGCSTVQRDDAFGILYAARAAENRALTYQAFNVARRQLDAAPLCARQLEIWFSFHS